MTIVKKTPLYEKHIKYGGKMVDFGGWMLPVQYAGILEEHRAVREHAGLFDVSHMGEVLVEGPHSLDFIQKIVTNDVSRIAVGQIQYTPMCYTNGGVVDDLLVYKLEELKYLLVINAANITKDWEWMNENKEGFAVKITNISDETAEIALQGPFAELILQQLTEAPLDHLKYYNLYDTYTVADKKAIISRTGYTGEDGFEVYCSPEDAEAVWEAILEAGKPHDIQPAGLGCRDTLRFEACMPLYGHELSSEISPLEAGLGKFVALDKEDFNGKAALLKQKEDGVQRKIAGFCMTGKGIARAGYPVIHEGCQIGVVTTGSFAPTIGKNLGLALVKAEFAGIGQGFNIEIRNKEVSAEVVKKPFYIRKGK